MLAVQYCICKDIFSDTPSPPSAAVPDKEDLTHYHHQVLLYLPKRIRHAFTIKCCCTYQRGFDTLSPSSAAVPTKEDLTLYHHQVLL